MRSPGGRDDVGDSRSLDRGGGENRGNSVVVVSRRATDPIPANEKKKNNTKKGFKDRQEDTRVSLYKKRK